ncbi:immunoglobulin-like domain-containing protein [Gracilibacillus saliphilus]|uniref:immunoglobulin-like domain-containing protein n=1 Tax=Gracilibacillus saliphilus TaxID=543890 RepID=UPI0013CF5E4D|nr:immunoglobulin-like domain-containing protein [Gracilibacillus saliphilus]
MTPFTEKFANASADLPSDYKYRLDSSRLQLNQWQHVAVTIDGFNAKLFVNGEEVSSTDTFNVEPRMLMETTMNYLGKSTRNNQAYFAGGFDEFKLFNRALSANEIEALADELTIETPEEPEGPQSDPSLLLEYDMKNIDNNILQDQSGNFDGTLVNIDEDNVITTDQVGVIELTGEESYIEIPEGVLDDKESITVSTLVNWNGENSAEWLYTFGQNDQRYLYFTPNYNADGSARFGIATNGWQNEISTKTDGLKENEWKLVTTVFDGDANRLELYIDGELATSSEAGGYTLADIANMEGLSGYIGRSFYNADPYFKGVLADFKVYDGVLTTSDIDELKNEANEKIAAIESILVDDAKAQLIIDDLLGNNQSANEIMTDLDLPAKGSNNTAINWESSHPDIISEDGQVVRPANGTGNQTVTLTATITDGEVSTSKEFTFTVLEEDAAVIRLKEAIQSLIVHNIHDVRGNLTLPTELGKNIEVTWESTDPEMITTTGEVTRPEHGEGDSEVILTATLELDGERLRKAFKAKVKELPEEQDYEGYVFPHFTGEGYENGEQIYFALSEGNNPLKWQQLNDGEPVFTSELGEEGLRDPFIIRSPEGDKFYMIATDLKIYGNGDWNRAQTEGSRSIMVWESNDLVNWSEQRMVEVAPKEAGNTWAPEIFYDDTTGEYIVFWASKLYEDENNRNNGDSYQRMMYSKTRDFYTFTEPEVYMDYGYSIIDTTMIEHDGKIYRFTKDERGYHPEDAPNGKFIFQEVGDSVLDPNFEMIKEGVGKEQISRGEGPAIFKSNTEEKWYLFIDEFGGRGYVPFETSDLNSGEWTIPEEYDLPDRPRHGTVLPITADEYQALSQQVPQEEKKKEDEVTSISFEENDIHLQVNETKQLEVNVTPDQPVDLLWTSTNEEVAEVNSDGKVTAVSIGEAYITVSTTDGLYVDVAKVVVTEQDPEETSNQLEIEQQKEINAGETYYLQGTKVRIKMPEDLPEGTLLTIKGVDEEALTSEQNLQIAGDVYDFEIVYPEGAAEPKRPFGLTLGIEETYQEEEIAIYFYNASQHKWEKQVSDIDVEARTVTADVSHFSVYGVLQTIGQQNETPDDDNDNDNDQSAQPPSNNDEKTSNTDDNQSGKSADGTQQQQESNQQTDQNNKDLPNTATMLFNWLLLGAILLAIGLGLYFMRKRNVM